MTRSGFFKFDVDEMVRSSSDILDDIRQGLELCAIIFFVTGIEGTHS